MITLPHSLNSEKAYLGAVLLNADVLDEHPVRPEHLHHPAHAAILAGITALRDARKPVDFITLTRHLHEAGQLDACGGPAAVTEIFTFVPTAANAGHYAETILETYMQRRVVSVCAEYQGKAAQPENGVPALLDAFEQDVLAIATSRQRRPVTPTLMENYHAAIERLTDIMEGKIKPGILSGIGSLDKRLGGFHPGELVIISGSTGGGKTSLAHTIALHAGIDQKKPVLIFSYELPRLMVTNRFLASRGRVDSEKFRKGGIVEADFTAIGRAAAQFSAAITIEDNADMDIDEMRRTARRWNAAHPGGLAIIDYIQKVPHTSKNSRQREVAEVSDAAQKMAQELNVPVIALSQENEAGEAREARDIVFDCKTWLKIRRVDETPVEDEPLVAQRKIVIAKNNNGAVGTVNCIFLKQFVTFTEAAPTDPRRWNE